jgi:sulfoxide reductase heme-binding subunit YedZ
MAIATTTASTAYWYLTRGTGIVALVLLTLSVALGVANLRRVRTDGVPRFVFLAVHRSTSLLAVAFIGVHIVTSVLDKFAPIRLTDAVVPFAGTYRPLWLGFGAVAFDLLVAVTITSLLRRRFGYRAWRLTHWLAYASWPVALLHGLGTGSDVKRGWLLVIVAGCVIVMIVALVARATAGWPDRLGARFSALAASALVPLGLLVWLPSGPLAAGWAKRAGTPSYLLVASKAPAGGSAASAGTRGGPSFSANVSGTVRQGQSGGQAVIDITVAAAGQKLNHLHIQISGQPLEGGGVQMSSSSVTLGSDASPTEYRGTITALEGTSVAANLQSAGGGAIRLVAQLQIDAAAGTAAGTATVSPAA